MLPPTLHLGKVALPRASGPLLVRAFSNVLLEHAFGLQRVRAHPLEDEFGLRLAEGLRMSRVGVALGEPLF